LAHARLIQVKWAGRESGDHAPLMKNLLTGPTRCLLVRPVFLENTFYNLSNVFRLLGARSAAPSLGLLVVAAMLPPHWQVRYIDADVEPLTPEDLAWADIVMVGGISPQLEPMLAVVRQAHALGKLAVVGGSGPSLQPELFGEADFVVTGEAEGVIPKLLEDLGKGVRSGVYRSTEMADLSRAVIPRYELAKLDQYLFVGLGFTRGCPFSCEFCAQVEIFGKKTRAKSATQIVAEMQELYDLGYRGMIDIGYDNLIGDIARAEEVLTAMAAWGRAHGHPFHFSTEATMNLARQPRLLELMRDNDFRYVFVGIESGEDEVLDRAKKGQNTAMPAEEAVRIFNSYGLIVNTGLILGFDGESSKSGARMLEMVQKTGAFPSLVLPLHALPRTQLSKRLAREGRLFGGSIVQGNADRTDTATTGLNFVTDRPRTEILEDLASVLDQLYEPKNHYARAALVARQLRPSHKYKPSLAKTLQLARTFVRIAGSIGLDPGTRRYFWTAIARTLMTNPQAVEMVVGQAVFQANYAIQARSYVRALREQVADVKKVGEKAFNAARVARGQVVAESAVG
jgi:radical SAM superfamily enzyme YgiQ (UPF0313 family)